MTLEETQGFGCNRSDLALVVKGRKRAYVPAGDRKESSRTKILSRQESIGLHSQADEVAPGSQVNTYERREMPLKKSKSVFFPVKKGGGVTLLALGQAREEAETVEREDEQRQRMLLQLRFLLRRCLSWYKYR